jgi:SET domain-containing protein
MEVSNNVVEVRPSERHGRGVFANRDIKKGERMCYYDGEDIPEDKAQPDRDVSYAQRQGNIIRYGYVEPKTSHGIGQLMNDAFMPHLTNPINFPNVKRAFDEYEEKSKALYNTGKFQNSFWLYADKDIAKDEELTGSYGKAYWIVKFLTQTKNPFLRLILYQMHQGIDKDTLTDELATDVIEGLMEQPLNSSRWSDQGLDSSKPKELLLFIMQKLGF